MTNSNIQEQAVEAMIATNAAIQKIRLFPVSSPSTANSINEAYEAVSKVFEHQNRFVIEKSERGIQVCEQLLNEKEQNKIQVSTFLEILFSFGIRYMTFRKGLRQEDFASFLEIISEKPEQVEQKGGAEQIVTEKQFAHIFISSTPPPSPSEKKRQGGEMTRETFGSLIQALDTLLDGEDKHKISLVLAGAIARKDDNMGCIALTQATDCELAQQMFYDIVHEMDGEKFERLLKDVKHMYDTATRDGLLEDTEIENIRNAYVRMINSYKGQQVRKKQESSEKNLKEQLSVYLKSLLNNERQAFRNKEMMQALPDMIERFLARQKNKSVETILERLGHALTDENATLREDVSQILVHINEKLFAAQRLDTLLRLSVRLGDWIRNETVITPIYEEICVQLQQLCLALFRIGRFGKCNHILKVFNDIYSGKIEKDENIRLLIGNLLKGMAVKDISQPIIEEFLTNQNNGRKQAADRLIRLGGACTEQLLLILRDSQDKSERSRVLKLISDTKGAAIPDIKRQISQEGPWYYIRNLVLLFGRVGNDSHLKIIRQFLNHEDFRVQRETLNTIFKIGGKQGEKILLSVLPSANDRLKLSIVDTLGAMESNDAVASFMKLLESMPHIQPEFRYPLAEKICHGLGHIASPDAILALTEIFEQKSKKLSGKKAYNEKLKIYATNALAMKSDRKSGTDREKSSNISDNNS